MSTISTTKIDRIRSLSLELDAIGKTALEKASEVGRLLSECKSDLKHGEWLPWLESNFTFTDRTARRWIKLAQDIQSGKIKSDTLSNLSEAYRVTTEPKIVSDCPFQMPSPDQRLILFSVNGDCASIEPIDETYFQVTFTERDQEAPMASIAGTKRGIHRNYAWQFLTENSRADWKSASLTYASWNPVGPKNQNLGETGIDWVMDCLELLQGGQSA
jgi:hypothetical protein